MRRAMLREKAARALQVVAVTLEPRLFETVGNVLAFDNPERRVCAGFAALCKIANAVAYFLEHRSFLQTLPGGHKSDRCHAIACGFFGGFEHRLCVNKTVARGVSLIGCGLCAKTAVLRACSGLCIHDRAEVDFVALEALANTVCP